MGINKKEQKVSCKFSKGAIIKLIHDFGIEKTRKIFKHIKIAGVNNEMVFEYLMNEDNWISYEEMVELMKKIEQIAETSDIEKDIILNIIQGKTDVPYLVLQKTASYQPDEAAKKDSKKSYLAKIRSTFSLFLMGNPFFLYKLTPSTIKLLTKNVFKVKTEISRTHGKIYYIYNPRLINSVIELMCNLNKFALEFTPRTVNLPDADVFETNCTRKIENILSNIDYVFKDEKLFIQGKEYGEKIQIKDPFNAQKRTGVLITKPFRYEYKTLLQKNRIYNSPFCAYRVKWRLKNPFLVFFLLFGFLAAFLLLLLYYLLGGSLNWLDYVTSLLVLIGFIILGLFYNLSRSNKESLALLKEQDQALHISYKKLEDYNIQLEKKVEDRTAELKRLNQAQTDFLLNIAHSLQSPLAITKGNLEMINEEILNKNKKAASDKKVMSYSNIIDKATTRLSALINDLLELARMDFGKLKLEKEPVNMNEMLKEMQEEYEILALDKNLKFDFKLPKKRIILNVDKRYFKEAISNLLSNSLKYTVEGGIEVFLSRKGKNAIIEVKDTGIGIPAGEVKDVFKKFFRASNVPRGRGAGTGLGMSIVKWIVENHKGKLTFKTRENKGSTFTIEIPIINKKEKNEK
ncbi:HAMP domain-containing histidine kinase [Patescibacteria group bacterium]|nr:HAMP domain-containing histidine kinase [Patescibacteria group bacterium]MBU1964054.1 HAMP domain-containing histidine kinase [Patescibacteria group bacterium]